MARRHARHVPKPPGQARQARRLAFRVLVVPFGARIAECLVALARLESPFVTLGTRSRCVGGERLGESSGAARRAPVLECRRSG